MLAETVREAADRFGNRPAVVADEGWSVSYSELDALSDEVAAGLAAGGVAEGDVVALVLPPVPEHIVLYCALAKMGAVTAAVNPRLTVSEREAVIDSVRPGLVVATGDLVPQGDRPILTVDPAGDAADVLRGLRARDGAALRSRDPDPDRPCLIVFTSGTTGRPKGAVFGARQIDVITDTDVGPAWGGGGDVMTGSVLAHLGPMTKLEGHLRRGSTQHLMRQWKARDALARIASLEISAIGGVPSQFALMLREPDFDNVDLSAVRAVIMGGGPATPALLAEIRERFGVPVMTRYSCTEAGIGTGTSGSDPDDDGSVGRPQPGVSIEIVDGDGDPVAQGEVGRVCLASGAVMSGYWNDPVATQRAFTKSGAVHTGDLGFVDEEGRLHLAGRATEMYVRGGYNVHPVEVEAVLSAHPDVAAVAIVPVEDDVMGEVGIAVVVVREGRTAPSTGDLHSFAGGQLARYKLPAGVLSVDALPLTAMEKLDRRALGDLVAQRRDGIALSAGDPGSDGR